MHLYVVDWSEKLSEGWEKQLYRREKYIHKSRVSLMAVKAFVLFKVSSGSERDICQKLTEFDEVLEASIIYGEYDLVAKINAQDLGQLEQFLTEKVRTVPSVVLTSTMIVAREYKGKTGRNLRNRNIQ